MNFGRFTYTAWLLGAALPVLLLQWVASPGRQREALGATVPATLIVGTYLSIVDAIAIREGIWRFSDHLVTGVRVFDVPVEEILFFYLTSLLVTQSMALLLPTFEGKERPLD